MNNTNTVDLSNEPDSPRPPPPRNNLPPPQNSTVIFILSDDEDDQPRRPADSTLFYRSRKRRKKSHSNNTRRDRGTSTAMKQEDCDVEEVTGISATFRSTTQQDSNNNDDEEDDDECLMVGSKGVNALADFPHARENCVVAPMAKTWNGLANRKYCHHCYCYVCDVPAKECQRWTKHCNARHKTKKWQQARERTRKVAASKHTH